ncbi:PREDICTED: protein DETOXIFICATION 16-like isoform X2 [Tarenaya hassleriana]|nr:PREDICTED: protein DETOXIFICATION 16-like isoform X2 [Tarenaya hassleriana]
MGLSAALDTLCGQSHGAKLHRMLGVHTQRAMLVLVTLCIPLSLLWTKTQSILMFLGQNRSISEISGSYITFMIPGLFGFALLQCFNRFFTSQNKVFPLMLSSVFATLLHIPICWGFVFKFGFGIRGAALALSVSYWVNVILLSLYIKFSSSCSKSWDGFSREALENFSAFFQLAVPSVIMFCLTIWSSETMVFLSGLLPNAVSETSVFSTCLAIATITRMIPYASTAVISVRVSNELGAGNADAALRAIRVCFGVTIAACGLIGSGLIIARKTLGYMYSEEAGVVKGVASMVPLLSISYLLDSLQCILSGVLSGSGWQKIGALVNLGSYYLVGIPSAILFGFLLHMGATGLWMGIICAALTQVLAISLVMIRTNWSEEVNKANGRVYASIMPETMDMVVAS